MAPHQALVAEPGVWIGQDRQWFASDPPVNCVEATVQAFFDGHDACVEQTPPGITPIDRLAQIAPKCRISRARVVDQGRIITAGGITSGMEMGFHLLRRAGHDEKFISEVARVMEYSAAYEVYRNDRA